MKKILGIFVLILFTAGCDSRDNKLDCFTIEDLRESDCLSEAVLDFCDRLSCSSSNAIVNPISPNCEFVDCSTFQCQEVFYRFNQSSFTAPGTFTDLQLGETSIVSGIINVEGEDQEFNCFRVVQ